MKKILLIFLALVLLLSACSAQKTTPPVTDDPSTEQNNPTPDTPSIPSTPDVPITDIPASPDEIPGNPEDIASPSDTPTKPEEVQYPDISGFNRDVRTIVYAADAIELVSPQSKSKISFVKDFTFIRLGTVDNYTVILYKDELYLASTSLLTSTRPSVCAEKEKSLGGIYYPGGEKIVAIDAGHQSKGMYDTEPNAPGSTVMKAKVASGTEGVSTKIAEYVLNLNVSLLLRDELISRGYTVVMIRETHDVQISNSERAIIANNYKADAFIRVHANGSDNKNVRGAIAIFQTKNNKWCGDIYPQSRALSEAILSEYCKQTGIENDGNYEDDTMTGINWTEVPATIIELGYMSNAEEDKLMATTEFHKNAAIGIARGVDLYFSISGVN